MTIALDIDEIESPERLYLHLFPEIASLLLTLTPAGPHGTCLQRQVMAMGTALTLNLEGGPRLRLSRASTALVQEVERIEAACSTWRADSTWTALNRAQGAPVPLDQEWLDLLATIQTWNRDTEGSFDPVIQPLMAAWAVRTGSGASPDPATLASARSASGCQLLDLDPATGTARFRNPQAGLEEGGFLKGYALDAARRIALAAGARAGFLDFGGQILVWGRPRRVAIADPIQRQVSRFTLWLRAGSLSSSGCSERGRHILDPRTGLPCPAWGQVSVLAATGLEADVLSTALFVLGPEAGLRWATDRGVAALFLPVQGTASLTPAFQALAPRPVRGPQP